MNCQPKAKTAEQAIISVIKWADRQGFINISDALHHALALLRHERDSLPKAKP